MDECSFPDSKLKFMHLINYKHTIGVKPPSTKSICKGILKYTVSGIINIKNWIIPRLAQVRVVVTSVQFQQLSQRTPAGKCILVPYSLDMISICVPE